MINKHAMTKNWGIGIWDDQGMHSRYNGADIHQMHDYIKLSCDTYCTSSTFSRLMDEKSWVHKRVTITILCLSHIKLQKQCLCYKVLLRVQRSIINWNRRSDTAIIRFSVRSFMPTLSVALTLDSHAATFLSWLLWLPRHQLLNTTRHWKILLITSAKPLTGELFIGVRAPWSLFWMCHCPMSLWIHPCWPSQRPRN